MSSFWRAAQLRTSDTVVSDDRTAPTIEKMCLLSKAADYLSEEESFNDPAQNIFIAAANTAYYIIYETDGGCGSGKVTIEASTPLVQNSCSSPYKVSVEIGDTVEVKDINTCEQGNSNDGLAFEPSLGTRDFVILLESSSVARQIFVSSESASSNSVQVISQQCSTKQTSDTV
eukprot:710174-Pelagomonas_calceolata.AAC.1